MADASGPTQTSIPKSMSFTSSSSDSTQSSTTQSSTTQSSTVTDSSIAHTDARTSPEVRPVPTMEPPRTDAVASSAATMLQAPTQIGAAVLQYVVPRSLRDLLSRPATGKSTPTPPAPVVQGTPVSAAATSPRQRGSLTPVSAPPGTQSLSAPTTAQSPGGGPQQQHFHMFLEKMKDPSAVEVVGSIKTFIKSFTERPYSQDEHAAVRTFLNDTEKAIFRLPKWQSCSADERESASDSLEKYVMTKIYSRAFCASSSERDRDNEFSRWLTALQWLRPEHLDIHLPADASWHMAQAELAKINAYKAPRDKLVCILNCCKVIINLLAMQRPPDAPPGADDFLPVLIYVVVRANVANLQSNVDYVMKYRHPARLVSEQAYYLANLSSALHFVDNLDATQLNIDPEEFSSRTFEVRRTQSIPSTSRTKSPTFQSTDLIDAPVPIPPSSLPALSMSSQQVSTPTPSLPSPSSYTRFSVAGLHMSSSPIDVQSPTTNNTSHPGSPHSPSRARGLIPFIHTSFSPSDQTHPSDGAPPGPTQTLSVSPSPSSPLSPPALSSTSVEFPAFDGLFQLPYPNSTNAQSFPTPFTSMLGHSVSTSTRLLEHIPNSQDSMSSEIPTHPQKDREVVSPDSPSQDSQELDASVASEATAIMISGTSEQNTMHSSQDSTMRQRDNVDALFARYQFYNLDYRDLRMSDIPMLLDEYKQLVRELCTSSLR